MLTTRLSLCRSNDLTSNVVQDHIAFSSSGVSEG